MRARYTSLALATLLMSWLANQFPLWGTDDPISVANDWAVAYLFLAGAALIVGTTFLFMGRADPATAGFVLTAGFYGNAFMMELAKQEQDTVYAAIQALLAITVLLAFVIVQRPWTDASAQAPVEHVG